MFSYCGNNPITREDCTGEWWHVLIAAGISGTSAALSSAVFGASFGDCCEAFVTGLLTGALATCGVEGAAAAAAFNMLFSYHNAIENGATDNEALGIAGISLLLSAISSNTGSFVADSVADAVWGFVGDLGENLAEVLFTRDSGNTLPSPNEAQNNTYPTAEGPSNSASGSAGNSRFINTLTTY